MESKPIPAAIIRAAVRESYNPGDDYIDVYKRIRGRLGLVRTYRERDKQIVASEVRKLSGGDGAIT